jgi:hypothetical protein
MLDQSAFRSKKSKAPEHSAIGGTWVPKWSVPSYCSTRETVRGAARGEGSAGVEAIAARTLRFRFLQLLKLCEPALGQLVSALADELERHLRKTKEKTAAWAHLGHVCDRRSYSGTQRNCSACSVVQCACSVEWVRVISAAYVQPRVDQSRPRRHPTGRRTLAWRARFRASGRSEQALPAS